MKILFVNSFYPTSLFPTIAGGAEKSVSLLAKSLAAQGHDVRAFAVANPNDAEAEETEDSVIVHHGHIKNLFVNEDGVKRNPISRAVWHLIDDRAEPPTLLTRLVENFRPDIVHTNVLSGISTSIWRMAHENGAKVVHTLRDYYLLCPRRSMFRENEICKEPCLDCGLFTLSRRNKTAHVDAAVGITQHILKRHTVRGLFPNATHVAIGNNIEVPIHKEKRRIREKGAIRFGYIGRMGPEKGVELLVQSYMGLNQECRLLLAGTTSDADRARFASYGSRPIEYLGFVKPSEFYSSVDVVVVPSLWEEPLSRAVIDAVASGVPVIASNRGGIPEALGGLNNGWLFDPGVSDSLREVMSEICLTRKIKSPTYEAKDVTESYVSLYRQIQSAQAL